MPRKLIWPRSRLLLGGIIASVLIIAGVVTTGVHTANAAFVTIIDQQGVNDVNPAQVDLTQMGRDESDASYFKVFWSWDSTGLWSGTGQTGDACALFDTNGDGNINFVVCGEIHNTSTSPDVAVQGSNPSPTVWSCDDAKNDRCGQPASVSFTSSDVACGAKDTMAVSPPANLVTATDPFPTGSDYPNDVSLQCNILKSFLPSGAVFVNVCSYPSIGNGGNNNPFDCIVAPGTTPTPTPSPTPSPSPSPTHSPSPTPTPTPSPTPSPSPSPTHSPSPTPAPSPSPSPTPIPTETPFGQTPSPTPSPTPIPTATPFGQTPSPTPSPTPIPTETPAGQTPSPTPSPTALPAIETSAPSPPAPTPTPKPTPTALPATRTPSPGGLPSTGGAPDGRDSLPLMLTLLLAGAFLTISAGVGLQVYGESRADIDDRRGVR